MRTKSTAFLLILSFLFVREAFAQDKAKSPLDDKNPKSSATLVAKFTWINCYWSSKTSKGKFRKTSANKAGWVAKKQADDRHLPWAGFDIATEVRQQMFLDYVGAEQLPNPFADKVVVQRFWDLGAPTPTPAPEFVVLAPDATEDEVKKIFSEYLERTKNPPSTTEVDSVEWKPGSVSVVGDSENRSAANEPTKVVTANK
jgi:hypothetical protein